MSILAIADEGMTKAEFKNVQLREVDQGGGLRLALNSFAELEKFSHFMAMSKFVPKHLREKQADCLAVLLQSMRWNMDPFSVAQKTYFVNDGMAYEAQLVNAIVLSRAQIKTRPKLSWSGEGEDLKCKVSAIFLGEDEPLEFEAEMKTISTRNSPLWKQQPKQQLGYFALRAWARLYCPDVLMGVYTKDEMEDASMHIGADNAIDVTPKPNTVVGSIMAGISAEKESMQPIEEYDPETGEIIENTQIMVESATRKDAAVKVPVESQLVGNDGSNSTAIDHALEIIKRNARDAAINGTVALEAWWKELPAETKAKLKPQLEEYKKIASENEPKTEDKLNVTEG